MKAPIVFMRKAENDMKYAICYSSRTGNTGKLAEAIRQTLPTLDCVYCGAPHVAANSGDVIFAGFWTDKGTCDSQMGEFLQTLENKKVFLFGTAGFGGSEAYFTQILERVQANVPDSCEIVGTFMCQGKMPDVVRERYAAMEPSPKRDMMLENFQNALAHPNEDDLTALTKLVQDLA